MPTLFLIYPSRALPPFTYILELMTRSQQRPSWLSWQSVALDSRGREFDSYRRPWSCIFRNWSRLSLRKIYTLAKYPYRLPLLVIECKMPILFLIYPIMYTHRLCKSNNMEKMYACMWRSSKCHFSARLCNVDDHATTFGSFIYFVGAVVSVVFSTALHLFIWFAFNFSLYWMELRTTLIDVIVSAQNFKITTREIRLRSPHTMPY